MDTTEDARTSKHKRVALIASASTYVGPELALLLASRGHDLVLGEPSAEQLSDLRSLGARVHAVDGVRDLSQEGAAQHLVDEGLAEFGRIDAATMFSGAIVVGRFLKSSIDDMRRATAGCIDAPYLFLKAVVPPMIEAGGGQVLVMTSASGARATPGAPLYSAARAGANHLVRNVADEVARHGVQVNAVGTNFMDFPGFLAANRIDSDEARARVEAQVPLGRLGRMDEFAAFSAVFLDGSSTFTTGQFVSYSGGWS